MTSIFELNRPNRANALDLKTAESLNQFLKTRVKNKEKFGVISSANPKIFCSGGDLQEYKSLKTKNQGVQTNRKIREILLSFRKLPLIVAALVEGKAIGGGCELALASDIIFCSPSASFCFRQGAMGLSPGWGGLQNLLLRVPRSRALDLLVTGRCVSAHEALKMGLVDFVLGANQLRDQVQEILGSIPSATDIRRLKELVFNHSLKKEVSEFNALWMGPKHKEQLQQFFE